MQGGGTISKSPVKTTAISVGALNCEEWAKQILFWRSHLDIFVEDYFGESGTKIKLQPFQNVVMREMGNSQETLDIESRGLGKTWKIALLLLALCVLYPGTLALVISRSARQARITAEYIDNLSQVNDNIRREITKITLQKDYGIIKLGSSQIKICATGKDGAGIRGNHAKIIVIDEAAWVSSTLVHQAVQPILKYKRDVWWQLHDSGFEDYPSKLIEASSAFLKSVDLYQRFKTSLREIRAGADDKFFCCIPYTAGIHYGMFDEDEIANDRMKMTVEEFDMEYNAVFLGGASNSFYPYDLTAPCRTLTNVEVFQPANSQSRYVAALDVATSASKYADNAALAVVKLVPVSNGKQLQMQLVYLTTYRGYSIGELALEVRKTCVKFPNIEKFIVDVNAIGEGVVSFLETPYVDPLTHKEYPPFVSDKIDPSVCNINAIPMVREFRGSNAVNNRGAVALKKFFENRQFLLPCSSIDIDKDSNEEVKTDKARALLAEERAVYVNTDALQVELGNIKPILMSSGVKYDNTSGHKDRYSAIMMIAEYVDEIEGQMREEHMVSTDDACLAMVFSW